MGLENALLEELKYKDKDFVLERLPPPTFRKIPEPTFKRPAFLSFRLHNVYGILSKEFKIDKQTMAHEIFIEMIRHNRKGRMTRKDQIDYALLRDRQTMLETLEMNNKTEHENTISLVKELSKHHNVDYIQNLLKFVESNREMVLAYPEDFLWRLGSLGYKAELADLDKDCFISLIDTLRVFGKVYLINVGNKNDDTWDTRVSYDKENKQYVVGETTYPASEFDNHYKTLTEDTGRLAIVKALKHLEYDYTISVEPMDNSNKNVTGKSFEVNLVEKATVDPKTFVGRYLGSCLWSLYCNYQNNTEDLKEFFKGLSISDRKYHLSELEKYEQMEYNINDVILKAFRCRIDGKVLFLETDLRKGYIRIPWAKIVDGLDW